jgi:hypothetical protein
VTLFNVDPSLNKPVTPLNGAQDGMDYIVEIQGGDWVIFVEGAPVLRCTVTECAAETLQQFIAFLCAPDCTAVRHLESHTSPKSERSKFSKTQIPFILRQAEEGTAMPAATIWHPLIGPRFERHRWVSRNVLTNIRANDAV